jgi:hypothetical protein
MLKLILAALVGLLPSAAFAAFAIFQTYAGPPQIFYNIVTDGGAACNGDVLTVTRTASITTGTKNLSVTVDTFASGDVGKNITINGAGNSGGRYFGTISTFTDAQNVVLSTNATTTLSVVSTSISYGISDNAAFDTFNNWARANQGAANQVVLTIPNGSSCWFGNGTFNYISVFNAFAAGINNLIVEGAGATINSMGGQTFQLGGLGICSKGLTDVAGCSARIQSVSSGSSTVTLTTTSLAAGYISRFSVGRWVMLGGLDIQGIFQSPFGYPPNSNFFEWRKITAVDAGTGVITLDRSLTNSYQSDWAQYNAGNTNQTDAGGPATIWAVGGASQNSWNSTVEYRGLTINQDGQTYANARNVTFRDVTFGNAQSAIPSQNETWSAINTTFINVNMETDKLVGTMLMDGVTIAQIIFQSSSTDLFIMRNSTVTNRLDGGAKRTEISDSVLNNWGPGFFAYGNTAGASSCTRCNITTINTQFGYPMIYSIWPYSMASGLITMPNSLSEGQRPFIPNTRLFFQTTGYFSAGMWDISTVTGDGWPAVDGQTATTNVTISSSSKNLGVSTPIFASGDVGRVIIVPGAGSGGTNLKTFITAFTDAQNVVVFDAASTTLSASSKSLEWGTSNTYMQTNASGGFPDLSALSANPIQFRVLGSPAFTCDDCTGDANAVGMSVQAGATSGAPLAEYITRTFTASSVAQQATMPAYGKFVSLTIDVTQPFVGTGTSILNPTAQFSSSGGGVTVDQSTWTQFRFWPTINLKQAGTRVITPGGVTCNGSPGGCSGDTISAPSGSPLTGGYPPNAVWVPANINPWTGGNFSGMTTPPTFTITMQTDQSAVP